MDGGKRHATTIHLFNRQPDGFRDVEKFEIEHDLMATVDQPIDCIEPAGHKELQPDLEKSGSGFALFHHLLREVGALNI